jgi:hypothetical protein
LRSRRPDAAFAIAARAGPATATTAGLDNAPVAVLAGILLTVLRRFLDFAGIAFGTRRAAFAFFAVFAGLTFWAGRAGLSCRFAIQPADNFIEDQILKHQALGTQSPVIMSFIQDGTWSSEMAEIDSRFSYMVAAMRRMLP